MGLLLCAGGLMWGMNIMELGVLGTVTGPGKSVVLATNISGTTTLCQDVSPGNFCYSPTKQCSCNC